MGRSIHWAQKRTAKLNREKITSALYERPMTFTDLIEKLRLSRPVLSAHLNYLRENRQIEKALINEKVVYVLSNGAYELPHIRALIFNKSVFSRIMRELIGEDEAYTIKVQTVYEDDERVQTLIAPEVDSPTNRLPSVASEAIISTVVRWLTPLFLYTIVQEIKTDVKWTETLQEFSQNIKRVIKEKGLSDFESTLKAYYAKQLVQKRLTSNIDAVPILVYLDNIFKQVFLQRYSPDPDSHEKEIELFYLDGVEP